MTRKPVRKLADINLGSKIAIDKWNGTTVRYVVSKRSDGSRKTDTHFWLLSLDRADDETLYESWLNLLQLARQKRLWLVD